DVGGAWRDLMGRKILHRLANGIRGFAEIEVEHSMRVGNHGGVASGQVMLLLPSRSHIPCHSACHGSAALRRRLRRSPATNVLAGQDAAIRSSTVRIGVALPPRIVVALPLTRIASQSDLSPRCGERLKKPQTFLALAGATGCNSPKRRSPAPRGDRSSGSGPMHGTIDSDRDSQQRAARERAYSIPLETFDPADPELFKTDTFWPYFDRLRKEEPVHYCKDSMFGPYWSVTRYADIMDVETNHSVFSSASSLGGINIRERSAECLDNLPKNDVFDWVDRVSIELTTQMLAVLFDFPWEDRRKLTRWSDVATTLPGPDGVVATEQDRQAELMECAGYFGKLWNERINQPPKSDLLSMMAHSEATRDMDPRNFLGNLILLIVGGNDTTRNTLSGSIYALDKNPDQFGKLRDNP